MTARPFELLDSPLDGTNLIEASAGTGKTYTIAGLVLRLLLEEGLPVERILVVTFTVAATEELRGRVRRRIREALDAFDAGSGADPFLRGLLARHDHRAAAARLEAALREFDDAPIFTIHGFCQRVLRESAFEGGLLFDAELITDPEPLLQEVVDDYWRRRICAGPPLLAGFAARRGFSAESLLKLLKSYVRHPFLEVIPDLPPEEVPRRLEAFLGAFESVRGAWPGEAASVERVLREHPGLSRSEANFREDAVDACVAGLERCLGGGDAAPRCFGALRKVASGSFREKGVLKKGHEPPENRFFDLCQALADAEDELFLALRVGFLREARRELDAKKAARNAQGFDDLLTRLHGALRADGGAALARALRERYGAALIDEFQDTDPIQYEIFDRVFGTRAEAPSLLFLIGDPKQAIYGFRGADVFAYLEASHRAGARYTLTENWRSEPDLIDAVAALFPAAERPFVFPEIGMPPVRAAERRDRALLTLDGEPEAPFRLWFVGRDEGCKPRARIPKVRGEREIPPAVAAEISRLLEAGREGRLRIGGRPLGPGDIAVLTRKNRQAGWVQEALRRLGVPSVLYSTESLFASREAAEVQRVVAALAEPGNETLVKAAATTDCLGLDGEGLYEVLADETAWEGWLGRFRDLHRRWAASGFLAAFRRLLSEFGVRETLLGYGDGERRLTNVLHLGEVLHRAAVEGHLGPAGLARWLAERRADGGEAEEHQLRLESDAQAVKLVTVHRSKGLEYPVVFCPFSWEGSELSAREPGLKVHLPAGGEAEGGRFVLDLGSEGLEEHRRRAEVESLAENVRLLYVALTRARNRCYFVWGPFNTADTSAAAYLVPNGGRPLGDGGLEELRGRLETLGDAELREAFAPLRGAGAAEVGPLPAAAGVAYRTAEADTREPAARRFAGSAAARWGVSSFSSLVLGAPPDEEPADRDGAGARGVPREPAAPPAGILGFPAGAAAGTFLHDVLEHLDFGEEAGEARRSLVGRKLSEHGFGAEWGEAVEGMASDLLRTPLDPGAPELTLSRIPPAHRLAEAEFLLPLRPQGPPLTPAGLARAFREAGVEELAGAAGRGVPERLGRLEFSPARGYLRGFMDLVFRFGDRYYLVDWKSNRLGDRPEDYGPAALAAAMAGDHYVLQYHLYAVALHRHLGARLPGYDFGRNFGGVFYVFLRGVDPTRPGSGVFADRLSRDRVENLSHGLLDGRGAP